MERRNVSEYHHAGSYSVNTFYIAFEPNGDISAKGRNILTADNSSFDGWRTLPVSSHIPTVYTYDESSGSQVIHADIIYSYEGTESIKVRDRTFTVQKIKETIRTITKYLDGNFGRQEYSDFLYYAPEISFFAKGEAPKVSLEPSPDLEFTLLWELQEVVVK